MNVELRFFAMFRDAVGEKTLRREYDEGATVGDVLRAVEAEFPALAGRFVADGELSPTITVMRNGTNVTHFEGIETALADGDALSITPPVTGGCGR